jgi:sterol 3beta-glucosyltransferase
LSLRSPATGSGSRRIDVLAIGSRGDVQPFVALGRGLERAGHRVRIVTLGGFEEFVGRHGLDHVAIGGSPREIAATEAGQSWIRQRASIIGFLRGGVRVVRGLLEEGLTSYWRVCRDAEMLITSIGWIYP